MITPGTRVRFNTDDQYYGDEYGVVAGTVPRRHYYEKIVYRISLEKGGNITATIDRFETVGGQHASGDTTRAKARPYGSC